MSRRITGIDATILPLSLVSSQRRSTQVVVDMTICTTAASQPSTRAVFTTALADTLAEQLGL